MLPKNFLLLSFLATVYAFQIQQNFQVKNWLKLSCTCHRQCYSRPTNICISAQSHLEGKNTQQPTSGYPEGISYSPLSKSVSTSSISSQSFRKVFAPVRDQPSIIEYQGQTRIFLDTADIKCYRYLIRPMVFYNRMICRAWAEIIFVLSANCFLVGSFLV